MGYYQNVGGLRTRLDTLRANIDLSFYDFIFLSESWLNDDFSVSEVKFSNYETYRCDRDFSISNKSRGGGVLILVNSRFRSRLVPCAPSTLSFDHVFVSLELCGVTYILGCTYIPPASSLDVYLEHCHTVELLHAAYRDAHFFLAGDYNLTSAVWTSVEEVGMMVECSSSSVSSVAASRVCESFNGLSFRQVNSLPNNHGVFLDLLFSDIPDVQTRDAPDLLLANNFHHRAVCFDIPVIKPVEFLSEAVHLFDYAKCNQAVLRSYLAEFDWSTVFLEDNLDSVVQRLNEVLLAGVELSTPRRTIRPSTFPKWFSSELRKLTFQKKAAHLAFKKSNLQSDYERFSALRSRCCFLRDRCHKAHLEKVNNRLLSDPQYFWRYSDETRKVSGYPRDMFFCGVDSSSLQETADLFAQSFSSVYMASDSPVPEYPQHDVIDFNLSYFSQLEVSKALSSLHPKFSSGPDCIPSFILKSCSSILSHPLTEIFNRSLSSGKFPSEWKKSFVIPIFKSGNRCDVSNYRGVCIQSVIPKILDKLICERLSFASKSFIDDRQHGFISKRSTVTNLLCYQQDILQSFESGYPVHAIYTDVAKAFDRVDSCFLIAKLRSYGLGDTFLLWLSDYLCDRTQQVKLGNTLSLPLNVVSGVGQGSHIGPLLFSLFFNDLPSVIQNSSVLLFADDVKLYKSITSLDDCVLLQQDLAKFHRWLSSNGMNLSLHKCAVIEFSRSNNSYDYTYQINCEPLSRVHQIKDLGIILDRNLSFCSQVSTIALRCHRILGWIFRNSKGLSSQAFSLLYKSLVRSLLEYACVVWSPHYEVHKHTLERVQKKFKRYFSYRYPAVDLNLVPLHERREQVDSNFIESLVAGQVDCAYLLELVNLDCSRRLRNVKTYYVNTCDRNYLYFAPMNRMMRTANGSTA